MSGTAIATRGAAQAAQTTAQASRKGWFDSIKDEALSFVKGDNNAPWAILAETVIGCVPILGQIVDARDIIKGLIEVAGAPASPLAWFNLITALIGLIPGGGDAVKRSTRAIKSGAVHVDELLDMIRRLYKGDPEKLLRETLDVGKLRKRLDDILGNSSFTKQLSPDLRKHVDNIRANLDRQFAAFKSEVDGWLAKGRKTSAEGAPAARQAPGTPPAKPHSEAKAGSHDKTHTGDAASPHTPNAAQQRTARFKSLTQKVLGVLGEHMADYHCQDAKGWGHKVAHDQALVNNAKLNDNGHMVQLWPCLPRGRGIDAIWRTTGGAKLYAVIEAKASYDPTKGLGALLGEAGDKSERASNTNTGGLRRRGGVGGQGQMGGAATRQLNGKVTQMSHAWVQTRLERALRGRAQDLANLRRLKETGYSRHVLFFSVPQAVAHAEAVILHASGRGAQPTMHAAHEASREWGDNQISQVVNDRAGLVEPSQRRAR
ncbi:hypothetical protein [Roseateles sp. BYS87W]|uniref:Uncharacterized protein n=1 Tax=Pelomonas baiyunensis TaxID=3299026 RepID=A0ABW7GYM6_9BURK